MTAPRWPIAKSAYASPRGEGRGRSHASDIIAGVGALLLTIAMGRQPVERFALALAAWNVFGFLDLIAAVSLGVLSAEGSPVHFIQSTPGSAAIQTLPWLLIPTVLVPFYLFVHGVIVAQSRERARRPASGGAAI